MKRIFRSAAWLVVIAALATACGDDDSGDASKDSGGQPASPVVERAELTFLAAFRAQANLPFVGVYVAQEKGYFAAERLDVIIEHQTGGGALALAAQNRVQVTTADAALLLQRRADPNLPVVAIALIGQEGQQGWASLKGSGIERPSDWRGKRIGYRNTVPPDLLAILDANGLEPGDVKLTNIGFQPPQLLLEGIVDLYPVFLSNEPDTIRRAPGKDVTIFKAGDYGVPALGLVYVTSEQYLKEHHDVLVRFLRAALRGIEFARQNPAEAVDIVMKYAPNEEREHQRFMLETELVAATSGVAGERGVGWMTREQWQGLYDTLQKYGAINGDISDLGAVWDRSVLERARDIRTVP